MAMTDRNNPKRAASSDSQYSLMEFMRDFPDDAACLDWLWRTRYASDGEHAECPRCEKVTSFKRYPTKQQRQSRTCTQCSLHLHPTADTIFDRPHPLADDARHPLERRPDRGASMAASVRS
jgi:hypothetical protein